jgi:hypothetical protein
MSPIACSPRWRGRFTTLLPKGWSALPMSTLPCAGGRVCVGASLGQVLLNHLGGGEGGIEHSFKQFTGPMTAWSKVLGSPQLTPEVQQKLIDGVHAEVGSHSIDDLAAERDEILLGLLELRLRAQHGGEARRNEGKRVAWSAHWGGAETQQSHESKDGEMRRLMSSSSALDRRVQSPLLARAEFGGMAANDGSVPVRALSHAARLIREARELGQYGITASEPMRDYPRLLERVREVVEDLRKHLDARQRIDALRVSATSSTMFVGS